MQIQITIYFQVLSNGGEKEDLSRVDGFASPFLALEGKVSALFIAQVLTLIKTLLFSNTGNKAH